VKELFDLLLFVVGLTCCGAFLSSVYRMLLILFTLQFMCLANNCCQVVSFLKTVMVVMFRFILFSIQCNVVLVDTYIYTNNQ